MRPSPRQATLFADPDADPADDDPDAALHAELRAFSGPAGEAGRPTHLTHTSFPVEGRTRRVPTYVNEFWTARQRAASSLHEVSYRACFKPQLPRFFVERLTGPGEGVHDPFMGRGTTPLEAALLGRRPSGSDVNPLSRLLVAPRLDPPRVEEVAARLEALDLAQATCDPAPQAVAAEDLQAFFHPHTLRQLLALRALLRAREAAGELDRVDAWIRMVALNRLTGHSPGFFSVYTLPPNQAVSAEAQRKINRDREQTPPPRDVAALILKKTRALLSDVDDAAREALRRAGRGATLLSAPADGTAALAAGSIALVVTSPPFLDVVDYAGDNWLRCWFAGIDPAQVAITAASRLPDWQAAMTAALREQRRLLRPGGHVAFEVGEVRGGKLRLEEAVLPCAVEAGLEPVLVLINDQRFTKTANCWGVTNGSKGTNTNRVVLLRRP